MDGAVFLLFLYVFSSFAAAILPTTKTSATTQQTSTRKSTNSITITSKTTATSTESSTEPSPTPLPKSLSEKIDYQIFQTRLLTGIAEENRAVLKRLLAIVSLRLDNQDNVTVNQLVDNEKQHIENIRHIHQNNKKENDTLYVSFGTAADTSRYPWTVAVSANDRDRCGGTLIDNQHVLTAAHCIGTRTTTILLGSHLYNGGEEVKTDFYCVHNAYSSSNFYRNDMAIIRLAKPVVVRPPNRVSTISICNKTNSLNVSTSSNATSLWMVGWGLKKNDIEPNELQEAQVALADRSMCKGSSRYTDICVQSRSNTSPMGACTGDSGSGLYQQTVLTNRWCILGVASSSNADICEQTQYTTYANAASQDYVQWFKDVLDSRKDFEDLQKAGRCKARTWGQEFCRLYAC